MSAKRGHKPDDPHNCLCKECVYASMVRIGGPWKTVKQTKKEFMAGYVDVPIERDKEGK